MAIPRSSGVSRQARGSRSHSAALSPPAAPAEPSACPAFVAPADELAAPDTPGAASPPAPPPPASASGTSFDSDASHPLAASARTIQAAYCFSRVFFMSRFSLTLGESSLAPSSRAGVCQTCPSPHAAVTPARAGATLRRGQLRREQRSFIGCPCIGQGREPVVCEALFFCLVTPGADDRP